MLVIITTTATIAWTKEPAANRFNDRVPSKEEEKKSVTVKKKLIV